MKGRTTIPALHIILPAVRYRDVRCMHISFCSSNSHIRKRGTVDTISMKMFKMTSLLKPWQENKHTHSHARTHDPPPSPSRTRALSLRLAAEVNKHMHKHMHREMLTEQHFIPSSPIKMDLLSFSLRTLSPAKSHFPVLPLTHFPFCCPTLASPHSPAYQGDNPPQTSVGSDI